MATPGPGESSLTKLKQMAPQIQSQQTSYLTSTGSSRSATNFSNIVNSTIPRTADSVIAQMQTAMADVKLKQTAYVTAIANYNSNSTLVSSYNFQNGQKYTGLPGSTTTTSNSTSVDDCKLACQANTSCTGATYTPPSSGLQVGNCSVVVGQGSLSPSAVPGTVAIVLTTYHSLTQLQAANAALLASLDNANNLITNNPTLLKDYGDLLKTTNGAVNTSYATLVQQRNDIRNLLNEYTYLDTDVKDTALGINQSQLIYRLFLLLLVLIVFAFCVIRFDIKFTSVNWVALGLLLSFVVYILGMLTISAMIAFSVVLYVILR
jgi:hypothetical protein